MKIINDTSETLNYLVTPSGTTLSGSKVIASGWIYPFSAGEVTLTNAGNGPIVYVRGQSGQTPGGPTYISRKVTNSDSIVRIRITEEC
jgi:hypothetical protein